MIPDLSVIVVNWNTRELLLRALSSVARSSKGLAVETIVVDNASTDGSAAAVRAAFPDAKVVENRENVGFARGVNAGLEIATGRMIALLNSDACCEEESLRVALAYLESNPGVGLIGGAVRYPDGRHQPTAFRFAGPLASWLEFAFLGRSSPLGLREEARVTGPADWVSGAWMVLRREVLRTAGPMDASYFLYAEDMDWCRTIRRAGWDVHYVAEARAVHDAGGSVTSGKRNWNPGAVKSRLLYLRKHHGAAAATAVRLLLLASWSVALVPCGIAGLAPTRSGARFRDRASLLLRLIRTHATDDG